MARIDGRGLVIADIPGLIEGAHEGVGIGDRFLGHVERTRVLLHLVSGNEEDVAGAYTTVRKEVEAYAEELKDKREVVALSQVDSLSDEELKDKTAALKKVSGGAPLLLSSVAHRGTDDVLRAMIEHIETVRSSEEPEQVDPRWQTSRLDTSRDG